MKIRTLALTHASLLLLDEPDLVAWIDASHDSFRLVVDDYLVTHRRDANARGLLRACQADGVPCGIIRDDLADLAEDDGHLVVDVPLRWR